MIVQDKERRELLTQNQVLKRKRNVFSKQIGITRKRGGDSSSILEEMKILSRDITDSDEKSKKIEYQLYSQLQNVPNMMHDSVPTGEDFSSNVEIRRWGNIPKFSFEPRDHVTLSENNNLVDTKRAGKVAGSRFYFLKRELVRLNYALISFALDFISSKDYNLIQPPYLMNRNSTSGGVILSDFEDVIYKIDDEDLYLIATSEHALAAMHQSEIFSLDDIPKRYAGVSPCFRKEAGAHGRDTKGIFRVHQFEKVEQFVYSRPEDSWEEFEIMLGHVEEFYQALEIPYRIMLLSSGDMGKVAAKTYDLEAWFPAQMNYKEIVSCSNCTDYQSRRLGIKFRYKPHEESHLLHTLNSPLVATERTLIAILENYQQEDGSIRVPKVLQPYANGLEVIGPE